MRTLSTLALVLLSAAPAAAWQPLRPADPDDAQVTVTTITDVGVFRPEDDFGGGVAFADDAAVACQAVGRPGGLFAGHFAKFHTRLQAGFAMSVILFARAHNARVYVEIRAYNNHCVVDNIRTCFDEQNCQLPAP